VETVTLHGVDEKDVYIHALFDDPVTHQFIAKEWKVECPVPETDFRYALPAVGYRLGYNRRTGRKPPFTTLTRCKVLMRFKSPFEKSAPRAVPANSQKTSEYVSVHRVKRFVMPTIIHPFISVSRS
jgi:hypothetical protein